MNKKYFVLVAGLAAGVTWIAVAHAGVKREYPVKIDTAARTVEGSISGARNSADNKAYLGCGLQIGGGVATHVKCFARDSVGTTVTCSRSLFTPSNVVGVSPTFRDAEKIYMAAVMGISNDSYVEFGWDANGTCTSLWVENSSDPSVKVP